MEVKGIMTISSVICFRVTLLFVWGVFRSGVSVGDERVDVVFIRFEKKWNTCEQQSSS